MNVKDTINKYQANCYPKDSTNDDKIYSIKNSNNKPVVSKKPSFLKNYQPKPQGFNNKKRSSTKNNNQNFTYQKKGNENQEISKTFRKISWKEVKPEKIHHNINEEKISSIIKTEKEKENSLSTKANTDLVSKRSQRRPKTPRVKDLRNVFEQKESNFVFSSNNESLLSFQNSKVSSSNKENPHQLIKQKNKDIPKRFTKNENKKKFPRTKSLPSIENDGETDHEVKNDQEKESDPKNIVLSSFENSKNAEIKLNDNIKSISLNKYKIKSYLHKNDSFDGNKIVSAYKQSENIEESSGYLPMDGNVNPDLVSPASEYVEENPLLENRIKTVYDYSSDDKNSVEENLGFDAPPLPANNPVGKRSTQKNRSLPNIPVEDAYDTLNFSNSPKEQSKKNSNGNVCLSETKLDEEEMFEDFNKSRNKPKRKSLLKLFKKGRRSKTVDKIDIGSPISSRRKTIDSNVNSTVYDSVDGHDETRNNAKSASIDSFNENLTKRNKLERRSTKRNKLERRSCDAAIQGNFKIAPPVLRDEKPPDVKPNNCAIYEELDNSETIYDDIDDVPPPPPVRNQSLKSDPAAPPVPRRSHDNEEKPPPLPPKDIALDSDDVINYNDDVFNAELVVPAFNRDRTQSFLNSEPLYQVYRNRMTKRRKTIRRPEKSRASFKKAIKNQLDEGEWISDLSEEVNTSTMWRTIPDVINSGCLDKMKPNDIKLQQAQFEVITSQASYLRSLNVLLDHFMKDRELKEIIPYAVRKTIFSNVEKVHSIEQKFLRELENHFWNEIKLTKVCDLVSKFCKDDFGVYEIYIQNQVYQERKLHNLLKTNQQFVQILNRLESSSKCNMLPMMSFLLLPFQRACRLPLLIEAIVNAAGNCPEEERILQVAKFTLASIRKLVKKCNDRAKKMHQTEEIAELAQLFEYPKDVKVFPLVSQSRYLIKKGEVQLNFSKKGPKFSKFWLFLFNDVLFITKAKKSSIISGHQITYEIVDWAYRNFMFVNETVYMEHVIFLVILENQRQKRVEISITISEQNQHSRWLQALAPQIDSEDGEKIYEDWDCPQVVCNHPYRAKQADELSIDVGDVIKITKKTPDGWSYGERLRDMSCGWLPISHCDEIEDEHVRARNMKQKYMES